MSKSMRGSVFYRTEWLFPSSLDIPCWILDIRAVEYRILKADNRGFCKQLRRYF